MKPRVPKPQVFRSSAEKLAMLRLSDSFGYGTDMEFGKKKKKKCCRKFEKKGKSTCKSCPLQCSSKQVQSSRFEAY